MVTRKYWYSAETSSPLRPPSLYPPPSSKSSFPVQISCVLLLSHPFLRPLSPRCSFPAAPHTLLDTRKLHSAAETLPQPCSHSSKDLVLACCPSTRARMMGMWHIYTMEFSTQLRRKIKIWNLQENGWNWELLSERTQVQHDRYYVFPHVRRPKFSYESFLSVQLSSIKNVFIV